MLGVLKWFDCIPHLNEYTSLVGSWGLGLVTSKRASAGEVRFLRNIRTQTNISSESQKISNPNELKVRFMKK